MSEMIISGSRPRNVGWLRAAALLYGDWGTSKAYVIGLAVLLAGYAAPYYLAAIIGLTFLVGCNYVWFVNSFQKGVGYITRRGGTVRDWEWWGRCFCLLDMW